MGYITAMRAEVGQYEFLRVNFLVSINSTDIQAKGQASAGIAQAQANYNIAKKDLKDFKIYTKKSASQKN